MNKLFENTLANVNGGYLYYNQGNGIEVIDDNTGAVLAYCGFDPAKAVRKAEEMNQSNLWIIWAQLDSLRRTGRTY